MHEAWSRRARVAAVSTPSDRIALHADDIRANHVAIQASLDDAFHG
jgi:hypothetical protein